MLWETVPGQSLHDEPLSTWPPPKSPVSVIGVRPSAPCPRRIYTSAGAPSPGNLLIPELDPTLLGLLRPTRPSQMASGYKVRQTGRPPLMSHPGRDNPT